MNTISKALAMILVVVMCLGLFTTSAFATDILAGSSGGAIAGNDILGGNSDYSAGGTDLLAGSGFVEEPVSFNDYPSDNDVYSAPAQADTDLAAYAPNDIAVNTAAADNGDLLAGTAAAGIDLAAGTDLAAAGIDLAAGTDLAAAGSTVDLADGLLVSDDAVYFAGPGVTQTFSKDSPSDIIFDAIDPASYQYGFGRSLYSTGKNAVSVSPSSYRFTGGNLVLTREYLSSLAEGVHYFFGYPTYESTGVLVGTVMVQASSSADPSGDYVDITTAWTPMREYNRVDPPKEIYVTAAGFSFATECSGLAYSPNSVWASPMYSISASDYYLTENGRTLNLKRSFFEGISGDGTYYLWGYKTDAYGNVVRKYNFGFFTVSNGRSYALGTLTPDYQVWYSGNDPLTYYCDIFDAAEDDWYNANYYTYDNIVPDIKVSTVNSYTRGTSVRIDQYWNLGKGYFMLGQNFLSSLNPEETYYMWVVDARHPDKLYSNIVTFRVGPTLRAIDTDKHVINSTRSLRFRSSSPVASVYVGNIQLTDAADYGVSYDGKTITLSYEFLNKRSAGNTYTIKVYTVNGDWASTTFQVLTTAQGSASPRTGDESNLGLWAAFLLLSGTAVVVLIPKLRKQGI